MAIVHEWMSSNGKSGRLCISSAVEIPFLLYARNPAFVSWYLLQFEEQHSWISDLCTSTVKEISCVEVPRYTNRHFTGLYWNQKQPTCNSASQAAARVGIIQMVAYSETTLHIMLVSPCEYIYIYTHTQQEFTFTALKFPSKFPWAANSKPWQTIHTPATPHRTAKRKPLSDPSTLFEAGLHLRIEFPWNRHM
jgi:hypothetical protein